MCLSVLICLCALVMDNILLVVSIEISESKDTIYLLYWYRAISNTAIYSTPLNTWHSDVLTRIHSLWSLFHVLFLRFNYGLNPLHDETKHFHGVSAVSTAQHDHLPVNSFMDTFTHSCIHSYIHTFIHTCIQDSTSLWTYIWHLYYTYARTPEHYHQTVLWLHDKT